MKYPILEFVTRYFEKAVIKMIIALDWRLANRWKNPVSGQLIYASAFLVKIKAGDFFELCDDATLQHLR